MPLITGSFSKYGTCETRPYLLRKFYTRKASLHQYSGQQHVRGLTCSQLHSTNLFDPFPGPTTNLNDEFFIMMQVNEVKPDKPGFIAKGLPASADAVPI